jgi:Cdc6-like AAA superfamily ATPase
LCVPRTLEEGAIDHDLLATIADVAAGDARVALSILRTATRQAHQNHDSTITEDIVATSVPEACAERHVKDVETLTPHRRRSTRLSRARGDFVE